MDNSNINILLVDDEPDILDFVGYNLKAEGYDISDDMIRLSRTNLKDENFDKKNYKVDLSSWMTIQRRFKRDNNLSKEKIDKSTV